MPADYNLKVKKMAEEEGASNELLFFVDKDETIQLITAICSAFNNAASYAAQYDRLFVILNKYQEQVLTHLLTHSLTHLLTHSLTLARSLY